MIINRKDFVETIDKHDFNDGLVAFNLPPEHYLESLNGEGVWGWTTKEEKEKYLDDTFNGTITAILLSQPASYEGKLNWGDAVVLRCHGNYRPTLDPEWVMENLML